MVKLWSVLFAASALLLACHQPPTASRTLGPVGIGTIDAGGTLAHVIAGPVQGSVGERLQYTVSTFGNACVSPAGADVIVRGLDATVTPYDREYDGICIENLAAFPRPVTVVFDQPGDATVRVAGRSFYQPGLVTVERRVTIGP
jgi:hypothetical protein